MASTAEDIPPTLQKAYDVVPLAPLDREGTLRDVIATYGFVLDGMLDADKLEAALRTLITRKWRILGARLAENAVTGDIEFHVPHRFDRTTPPFYFTKVAYTDTVAKHVNLPQSLGKVSFHDDLDYSVFGNTPHHINELSHYLSHPRRPMMTVICSVYTDATLLGITIPHLFGDATGMYEVLKGISLCLQNRMDAVPDIPPTEKPFAQFCSTQSNTVPSGWSIWSKSQTDEFFSRFQTEVRTQPPASSRYVHIPGQARKRLQAKTQSELGGFSRLSTNDILVALFAKASFSTYDSNDETPVAIGIPYDIRGRLPELFKFPYLHNGISMFPRYPWLTVSSIRNGTLASLAAEVRALVTENLTRSSVTKALEWLIPRIKDGPKPFPHNGHYFVATSWRHAKFSQIDFSPALSANSNPLATGHIRSINVCRISKVPRRRGCIMLRDDEDGGTWVLLTLPDDQWSEAISVLEKLLGATDEYKL